MFIFGGDTGMTAEDIRQKRAIAARLATQQAAPRNVGEGLTAIGNALAYRGIMKATGNAERENREREAAERAASGARAASIFGDMFRPTVAPNMGPADTANPQPEGLPATPPELVPGSKLPPSLIRTESGGNLQAQNDAVGHGGHVGHFGRGQFGVARLQDAKDAGIIPANMTPQEFMASPGAQEMVESWHVQDIGKFIADNGLDQYVGQVINGTTITPTGMLAVAHLGGKGGLKRFLQTGGEYDREDVNGTSLTDYARTHGGGSQPTADPAAVQAILADPNVDAATKQLVTDRFRQMNTPQPAAPGFTVLAPAEVVALGLPEGTVAQRGPDGKISVVNGRGQTINVNTGASGIDYGDPPKDMAWLRDDNGAVRLDERGVPMAGYISGSPQDAERVQEITGLASDAIDKAKAREAGNETTRRVGEIVIEDIRRVREKIESAPWYDPATGFGTGLTENLRGSNAANVAQLTQTIRANIGFDRLQQMREASPTGGALGQVTIQELQRLESVLGSIEQSQSEDQLLENLDRLEGLYVDIMRKASAYSNASEFGFDGAAPGEAAQSQSAEMTFEKFSQDPSAQRAAEQYGVTLEEMWAVRQGSGE